jgi:TniQ
MANASNLLPWHPRRLDDEILSSWMLRIASGNGISVRSLCAWLGIDDDWVREIDSMDPYNPLVNHIAEAAGVEKEIVVKSLPSGLYGLFGESISSTDWSWNPQWRLRGGTPPNNVGNQYCPICSEVRALSAFMDYRRL